MATKLYLFVIDRQNIQKSFIKIKSKNTNSSFFFNILALVYIIIVKENKMTEKKQSQRCRERIIRESKALQKNLEKRKQQIAKREALKQAKQTTKKSED